MITFTNRNKLIAEFMGMQLGHPDKNETRWENDWFEKLIVDGNEFESGARHTHLQFHSSWDWLLPVVNKCTQIGYRDQDFDSEIYGTWEGLFDDASMFLGNHIEEVYWSVVHFIEWYAEYKREEAQEYPLTPKESYPVTKNK